MQRHVTMMSRRGWSRRTAGFFHELTSSPQLIKQHGRRSMSSCETNRTNRRYAAMWGNGDHGRLGHGSLDSQWTPKLVSSPAFRDVSIRSVACGGAHTLLLTETGRVFACGLNKYGQLGVSTDVSYSMEPREVQGLDKEIIQISAGYHHSCAVSADGEIYMWGSNSSGQLGLGKKTRKVFSSPTKLSALNGVMIRMAALGADHTIAVSDNGEALSWGGGGSGQLGHGSKLKFGGIFGSTSEFTPRLIKALDRTKVKSVSAGLLHSAFVDDKGTPYIFGEIAGGNLVGLKAGNGDQTFTECREVSHSTIIACGGYHICVITRGGDLYTFGSNENGCLGVGYTSAIHFPERVEGPFLELPVEKVSCGWKHTAAICGGSLFTWGWGGSHGTFSADGLSSGGQLGLGNDFDYFFPTPVEFEKGVKALEVSCGFNHTGAVLELPES